MSNDRNKFKFNFKKCTELQRLLIKLILYFGLNNHQNV